MTAPQGPPPGYEPSGYGPGGYGNGGYGPSGYGPGGYGPSGYEPPGYGYGYGYGPPQVEHPQATVVLILGILGIVTCQVLGPFAWVMGNRAVAEIDAEPGRYSNRGLVNTGRICGIVGTVLLGLQVAFVLLYVVFFVTVFAGSTSS